MIYDDSLIKKIIQEKKNIISLDLSERRCGIAIYIASSKELKCCGVINIKNRSDFLYELNNKIKNLDVQLVVWGISYDLSGKIPARFNYIKHMAHSLFQKNNIPYLFHNEFGSTKAVSKALQKPEAVDDKAAKFILIGCLRNYIKT